MGWRTFAGVLDGGTAACSAINAAFFLGRLLSGDELSLSRRVAAGALAVISLGALFEAVALLALAARSHDAALPASAVWAAVRVMPFAGAATVSVLIARRMASR